MIFLDFLEKVKSLVTPEKVFTYALKVPMVKINRREFLLKNFSKGESHNTIKEILASSPAQAGITKLRLRKVAEESIKYERSWVTAKSAATGLGGSTPVTIAGAVIADLGNNLAHEMRIIQKLAYIYGWPDIFNIDKDMDEESKNIILLFLGVMICVDGASEMLLKVSRYFGKNISKKILQKAISKTAWYPLLKKICALVFVKLTKKALANAVEKGIPLVAVVLSGAMTYNAFSKEANNLRVFLETNPYHSYDDYEWCIE